MEKNTQILFFRYCKTALVFAMAVFFSLIAFNNITDFGTNLLLVEHVMAMDTIWKVSHTAWHAIKSKDIEFISYGVIILWELVVAIICWFATIKLLIYRHHYQKFNYYRNIALFGLFLGFFLYMFVFLIVGGEWFQMWQSQEWNAQSTSSIFLSMIGFVILILLIPFDK